MSNTLKYIIIAKGDLPKEEQFYIFADFHELICCDGAVNAVSEFFEPTYIVGDMDSITDELSEKYNSKIVLLNEQESNDLTKAFHFVLNRLDTNTEAEIIIMGATGGREDHSLGNISLLPEYAQQLINKMGDKASIKMITNNGIFTPIFDSTTLELPVGTSLSLFSFDPTVKILSEGLRFPTDEVIFDSWWKATLNKTVSNRVTLTFSHPARVLMFLNN